MITVHSVPLREMSFDPRLSTPTSVYAGTYIIGCINSVLPAPVSNQTCNPITFNKFIFSFIIYNHNCMIWLDIIWDGRHTRDIKIKINRKMRYRRIKKKFNEATQRKLEHDIQIRWSRGELL